MSVRTVILEKQNGVVCEFFDIDTNFNLDEHKEAFNIY